jgi:hypothetical protein
MTGTTTWEKWWDDHPGPRRRAGLHPARSRDRAVTQEEWWTEGEEIMRLCRQHALRKL